MIQISDNIPELLVNARVLVLRGNCSDGKASIEVTSAFIRIYISGKPRNCDRRL